MTPRDRCDRFAGAMASERSRSAVGWSPTPPISSAATVHAADDLARRGLRTGIVHRRLSAHRRGRPSRRTRGGPPRRDQWRADRRVGRWSGDRHGQGAGAAEDPPLRVAAIPTTLSGAEMTNVHMHARPGLRRNASSAAGDRDQRPGAVRIAAAGIARPERRQRARPCCRRPADTASQHGHVARGAGGGAAARRRLRLRRARRRTWRRRRSDPRHARAGRAARGLRDRFDLVRPTSRPLPDAAPLRGVGHAEANAIMLPHSLAALARRTRVGDAVGGSLGQELTGFAARLCELGGVTTLREAGVEQATLEVCVEQAAARPELCADAAGRGPGRTSRALRRCLVAL